MPLVSNSDIVSLKKHFLYCTFWTKCNFRLSSVTCYFYIQQIMFTSPACEEKF